MSKVVLKDKESTKFFLIVSSIFILSYTVTRASLLSITSDESHTFIEFVNKGIIFLSTYDRASANDHFLNTWLMEITTSIFGISEICLRLPNLIAHFLFLVFSAKLLLKLSSNILIICSFLILNLNPFLLDFFVLARGYGLSIGLMMISLYCAYLFIVEHRTYIFAFISTLFSSLAVLASFTVIGYMLVVAFALSLLNIYRILVAEKDKKVLSNVSIVSQTILILSPLSILFFVIPVIIKMNHSTALFWGGETGFWKDTVFSLITQTMYEHHFMRHLRNGIQIGVVVVLITSFFLIVVEFKKNKTISKYSFLSFLLLILFSCFLMNFCQYHILGIRYLQERTALFYFPLFILLMAFLFDDLISKKSTIFHGIIIGFAIVFTVNFFVNINFHFVKSWKKESDTKHMIKDMIQYKKENNDNNKPIALSIFKWSWLYDNDIYYYQKRLHIDWLNFTGYYYYKDSSDFVYLDKRDVDSLNNPTLKFVKDYPCSDMKLFKKNK